MGHGYVRNNYGCNCFYGDSSFKRYNRAHGDTVIFNYNYGGNNHCCGGRKIGFWGALGTSLGFGLGNMVMGGLNMVGGWLGLGNGYGGGNSYGYGYGYGNMGNPYGGANGGGFWGGWNAGNNTRTTTSTTNTTNTRNTNTPQKSDIDNAKISDFLTEIDNLDTNPNKAKIEDLRKRIQTAKDNADDIQKAADQNSYDKLLNILDRIEKRVGTQTPATTPTTQENGGVQQNQNPNPTPTNHPPVNAPEPANNGNQPNPTSTTPTAGADEVLIGGKPIKINSIPDSTEIKSLNDLQGIDSKKAKEILDQLGYIGKDKDGNPVGKLSAKLPVLLLLEKSGINVEVEHRAESQDQWIKGPISNVNQNDDGIISYNVDCANVPGAMYNAKYTFTQSKPNGKEYTCKLAKDSTEKVNVDNSITLEFTDEKKPLENKSGRVLVKR